MQLVRQIVEFAIKAGSSDIHLEEGSPIAIRVNSDIKILDNVLSPQAMDQLLNEILNEEKNLNLVLVGILIHPLDLRDSQGFGSMPMLLTKNAA